MFPDLLPLFRAVKKLPPWLFCCMASRNRFRLYVTSCHQFATTIPDITDFREAIQMFTETFEDAVRIRMRSDAPFGAYLSGGMNSSAIVATMVRCSSTKIRTYSVGFREKAYSELDFARSIASSLRSDHHEVVIEPSNFHRAMDDSCVASRGAGIGPRRSSFIYSIKDGLPNG